MSLATPTPKLGAKRAVGTSPVSKTTAGYVPGSREYRNVVAALFAAGLATFALLYAPQAVLPELVYTFEITETQSALSMSLATLGLGCALLLAGPLSDVLGRTQLIQLSIGLSALVALACALAPTWHVLLVLRFAQGFVLAGLPATATAYLREELEPRAVSAATGLYIGGTAVGGMAGRIVTASAAEFAGWRGGLAAIAALALVCAIVVRLLLPPSRGFTPAASQPLALLAAARRVTSDRSLLLLYLTGACSVGSMVAIFNTLGFRLQAAPFGLGLVATSALFLTYVVGSISSTWFGRLADRHGRGPMMPWGAVLGVAGVAIAMIPWLPAIILGLMLMVAGFFAIHALASSWVPVRAHALGASAGQAASFYLVTYYVGSSVFGNAGPWAWLHWGWPGVAALSAGLVIVAGGLALALNQQGS